MVEAVRRSFLGTDKPRDRKGMRVVGNLFAGLGGAGIIAGFGMFFYVFYQAVSNPDPFAGPDGPAMVMSFVVMFVGIVVAGIGESLRRGSRRRF